MRREARGLVLAFPAVLLLRLSITDEHLLYVKGSMRPWLLVSGVLLAVLSLLDVFEVSFPGKSAGAAAGDPDEGHAELLAGVGTADGPDVHDHAHGDGGHQHRDGVLAWTLVLPFVVVFAIGPSPLGSFLAQRQPQTELARPAAAKIEYPPLPDAVDGAVDLSIAEFHTRILYDGDRQMEGVRLRMNGFVTPDADGPGGTFLLTKFMLSCCAADGIPITVRVYGVSPIPADDTWLELEGEWIPAEDVVDDAVAPRRVHEFRADSFRPIPVPADPYL